MSSKTTGGSGVTAVCDVSSETTGVVGSLGYLMCPVKRLLGVVGSLGYLMCPVKLLGVWGHWGI